MLDLSLHALTGILVLCIALSAFFSSTETALMSINRYRLRHLAREGSTSARAAEKLLERPDRLIGMILICNNFVNSAAAAIVTVISLSIGGEGYAAVGVTVFTIVLIIFGANRLPQLGEGLGKAIKGFKKGMSGDADANSRKDAGKRDDKG